MKYYDKAGATHSTRFGSKLANGRLFATQMRNETVAHMIDRTTVDCDDDIHEIGSWIRYPDEYRSHSELRAVDIALKRVSREMLNELEFTSDVETRVQYLASMMRKLIESSRRQSNEIY